MSELCLFKLLGISDSFIIHFIQLKMELSKTVVIYISVILTDENGNFPVQCSHEIHIFPSKVCCKLKMAQISVPSFIEN